MEINMNTYLLLFRGINVGGKNILPMAALKEYLAENDFHNIKTYIQTGNVILQSSKVPNAQFISNLIDSNFGFKPKVLVLNDYNFNEAIHNNPFKPAEGKMLHFYFCDQNISVDNSILDSLKSNGEKYFIKGNVFYLFAPNGIGRSKLADKIESIINEPTTARNFNTVNKLESMLKEY